MPTEIVIVAAGDAASGRAAYRADRVSASPWVVAVDAGVDLALILGLGVDLAIGDFDSLAEDQLERIDEIASEVRRFDRHKDATDLELALEAALDVAGDATRTVVVGVEGGRPDHGLANLALLSRPRYERLGIEVHLAHGIAWPVHSKHTVTGDARTMLSVVPMLGDAMVSITGVTWPLDHFLVEAGSTLGVSNEALGGEVALTVHSGTAMLIVPDDIHRGDPS